MGPAAPIALEVGGAVAVAGASYIANKIFQDDP